MKKYTITLATLLFIGCSTKELKEANTKLDKLNTERIEYLENRNTEYQKDLSRMLEKSIDHLGGAAKKENKIIYIEPMTKYINPSSYNNVNNDYLQKTYFKLKNKYENYIIRY